MSQTTLKNAIADEIVGAKTGSTSYDYIFSLKDSDGWKRMETKQDSQDFGIWVNQEAKHIFVFDHGERTLQVLHDDKTFMREAEQLADRHGVLNKRCNVPFIEAKGEVTFAFARSYELAF